MVRLLIRHAMASVDYFSLDPHVVEDLQLWQLPQQVVDLFFLIEEDMQALEIRTDGRKAVRGLA